MSRARRSQQGNILLPVALIGLTVSLTLGALLNQALVLEEVAVENRLAEIRSYWAVMGHFRYALSRTHHSRLCPSNLSLLFGTCPDGNLKDDERVPVLQNYLNEIAALRTWTYLDENSGYSIKINLTAAVDDNPSRQNRSGHLMITSSYPTTGVSTLGILTGAATRFMPYQIRFCVGLATASASCGSIGTNNGGDSTDNYSVKRLNRLNSVS